MGSLWFTSDQHFGHEKIRLYCDRPFATVEEMNEAMIAAWNSVVNKGDTVYHLGDFFLCDVQEAREIRKRLNGSICLLRGNHDKTADSMKDAFEWIKDLYDLKVSDPDSPAGFERIVLCHYAFRVWNRSYKGSWHLYGHSHGGLEDDPDNLSFDVGVDCHNFLPLSYEQVKQIIKQKSGYFPAVFR